MADEKNLDTQAPKENYLQEDKKKKCLPNLYSKVLITKQLGN